MKNYRRRINDRPRIGLDLHFLDGRAQGIRTHCAELFSRVARATPEVDFYCIMARTEILEQECFNSPNVFPVRLRHAGRLQRYGFAMSSAAREHQLDLLHCQFSVPPFVPCRSAVTIHDILAETHPKFFSRSYRILARITQTMAVLQASRIYTVSQYSKEQIMQVYNISGDKVSVLLNGVDTKRFRPLVSDGQNEVAKYGLVSGGYVLTVGRLEPRKNHKRLFQAYAKLPNQRPPLVVVGQKDFGYEEALEAIDGLNLQEEVRLLQDVSNEELPILYRNAKLFVYPSLAEGFGMPVLEAMASGVPVITSNNTALVEAAGSAALLVEPASVESIAKGMGKLLSDKAACAELIKRGLDQVKMFSWSQTAEALRCSYLELLG